MDGPNPANRFGRSINVLMVPSLNPPDPLLGLPDQALPSGRFKNFGPPIRSCQVIDRIIFSLLPVKFASEQASRILASLNL